MSTTSIPSGRVSADEILTLDATKAILGLGVHAMRQARRAGLKVRYVGRRGYVLGKDLIHFIETSAK